MAVPVLHAADGTEILSGTVMEPLPLELDRVAVAMGAAATNTFFKGHIDPDYARLQGRRDIYLATGTIAGHVDRYVLNWLGPNGFVRRRSVQMRASLCAGDVAEMAGTVVSVEPGDAAGRGRRVPTEVALVTFDMTITRGVETCVMARITAEVPVAEGDPA